MKVLFIAPNFFPFIGGAGNYVFSLCRQLKKKGIEPVVFTSGNKNEIKFVEGIKVYYSKPLFNYSNTAINFWGNLIEKTVETENPNIIVGSFSTPFMADSGAVVAEKNEIPFISVYFNDYIKDNFLEKLFLKFYFNFFMKKTLNSSKKILVLSDFYAKKSPVLKQFSEKTIAISPFIDLNEMKLSNKKNEFPENKLVLFVAGLNKGQKYKGLSYLIKSISILKQKFPEIKLIVIGSGNNSAYFKKLSKEFNLSENVFFTGKISQEKLLNYYSSCKTLVLPSTSNSEGFGLVLLEAMAFSKPVIGSNVGGIPVLIKNNFNGFLVEPKNPVKLAQAIEFILTNEKKAKEFGENSFRKAKEFSPEKSVNKLIKVFESVLNEKRK